MARVEKIQPMADEAPPARPGRGRRSLARSCAFLLFLGTLAVAGAFAWAVAASGLASVPVLSSFVYAAPVPSHSVASGLSLEAFLKSGSFDRNVEDIPETTLTALIRDTLATSDQTWFDDDGAQAAIVDGKGIEVFLPLRDNARRSAIVAHVAVSDDQGKFAVSVLDVTLGSLRIPAWIVSAIVAPAIAPVVASINADLP